MYPIPNFNRQGYDDFAASVQKDNERFLLIVGCYFWGFCANGKDAKREQLRTTQTQRAVKKSFQGDTVQENECQKFSSNRD